MLSGFISLCNVGEPCCSFDNDSGTGVQLPYLGTVIVGEKELSFDAAKCICEAFMVFPCKAHILVIVLCVVIWGIAVKEGLHSVILFDELLEVLVFDYHLLESFCRTFYQREVVPHTVRLTAEGVKPRCITVPYKLIEVS